MTSRLIFLPLENLWRLERIREDGCIVDFVELTAQGVAMRFDRKAIAEAMRKAAEELEAA